MFAETAAGKSQSDTNDKIKVSTDDGSSLQDQYEPLTSNIEVREPAWEVLEAQSPDYLACYQCKRHHPLSDIQKFALSNDQPSALTPCMKLDQKHRTAKFIHQDFHFTVFRMVMKQDRLKRDCTELLKLLSYRSGVLMDGSQVKQIIATPNIVEGRLLMRVQMAYVVPPTRESRLYLANKNHLKCPHSKRFSLNNRNLAWKIVNKFAALETLPEGRQEILSSVECNICFTKFQAGLQRFKGDGTMLFITKWQDLGTGLSPMESDIPRIVGPPLYIPFGGMGQRLISEPLQFEGQDLDPSSALTLKEREDQFRKSESKYAQKKRANDTLYWRWWGRQNLFPHEFAKKDAMASTKKATNVRI
ncbi:hypothetical protein B0O99DRAFT_681527 [Bisporella sp. PMI_857]|nr:hypothetical protein B0O99DRAFT_681527 [Bisporella sp. PMI_857]